MVREAPLTVIHLRNMATVTEAGGVIFPPVPAFYMRPTTIDELVDHSVGRALDQFLQEQLEVVIHGRKSDTLKIGLGRTVRPSGGKR
jgi:polyprenyl P-hydroxybenzoate/phenylacrylic acid decarboxylase-like protein